MKSRIFYLSIALLTITTHSVFSQESLQLIDTEKGHLPLVKDEPIVTQAETTPAQPKAAEEKPAVITEEEAKKIAEFEKVTVTPTPVIPVKEQEEIATQPAEEAPAPAEVPTETTPAEPAKSEPAKAEPVEAAPTEIPTIALEETKVVEELPTETEPTESEEPVADMGELEMDKESAPAMEAMQEIV